MRRWIARLHEYKAVASVNPDNIAEIAAAGVDTFVAGSAIFGKANEADPNRYNTVVKAMRDALATV